MNEQIIGVQTNFYQNLLVRHTLNSISSQVSLRLPNGLAYWLFKNSFCNGKYLVHLQDFLFVVTRPHPRTNLHVLPYSATVINRDSKLDIHALVACLLAQQQQQIVETADYGGWAVTQSGQPAKWKHARAKQAPIV